MNREYEIETLKTEYRDIGRLDLDIARKYAFAIRDAASLDQAAQYLIELKRHKRVIEDSLKPIIAEARKPLESLRALLDELTEPLDRAERELIKPAIARYEQHQEEIRRIEQMKREQEFKKLEEDHRLRMAGELEGAGFQKEAEDLLSQSIDSIPIELEKTKTDGLSFSWNYSAEIFDLKALVQAVANGKVSTQAISPNQIFLNMQARLMKDSFSIPGVVLRKERKVAARIQ